MSTSYLTDLTPIEARVLACLMEKHLATPDQYPLTENSLLNACNQKTNRNPVMNIEIAKLAQTLASLSTKGWVSGDVTSRSHRYQHRMRMQLKLRPAEQAVVSILLLRGPQTLNELIARTQRMVEHEDRVLDALEALMAREEAIVEQLPPQSGQREERYAQCLLDQPHQTAAPAQSKGPRAGATHDTERLDALEAEVADLKQQLARLLSSQ